MSSSLYARLPVQLYGSLLRECQDYPVEAGTGTRLTLVGHT